MEYRYNRLGEVKKVRDQNGTVRVLEYDKLGSPVHDRLTTLGAGVDGTIRRTTRAYDDRGLLETLTAYNNATVGSGNIVNQVTFEYDGFMRLTDEPQSHEGSAQ